MLTNANPLQQTDSAAAADAIPIREISRLTGINTVTLRAWERRYGLLKPERTHKGHRLYSKDDVARVKEIQAWLARGLAIGKVNAILSAPTPDLSEVALDSAWYLLQQQLDKTISHFNRRQLERVLEDLLALYPAEMLADELFLPLLTQLQGEDASKPARLAFFKTVLAEHLYCVQYRQRQLAKNARILLVSSSPHELSVLPLLLNYALLTNSQQAEFLQYLELQEAVLVAEALHIDLLIICGYEILDAAELQHYLDVWYEKTAKPILLVGRIARLYRMAYAQDYPFIYSCETQQDAIAWINQFAQGKEHYV